MLIGSITCSRQPDDRQPVRNYDLTWLLHALVIDEKSHRLAIDGKGVSAVEAYLQSRYHMYRNVTSIRSCAAPRGW
jgi:HD superfamily phosphohydrolase